MTLNSLDNNWCMENEKLSFKPVYTILKIKWKDKRTKSDVPCDIDTKVIQECLFAMLSKLPEIPKSQGNLYRVCVQVYRQFVIWQRGMMCSWMWVIMFLMT